MRFTIDSNSTGFQIKQGFDGLSFSSKKQRGMIESDYLSENYELEKFYRKQNNSKLVLVQQFTTITDMESALHELIYLSILKPGSKEFGFLNDNGSSSFFDKLSVINKGLKVNYYKIGSDITLEVTLSLTEVAV